MKRMKRSKRTKTVIALTLMTALSLGMLSGCGGSDGFTSDKPINVISREEGSGTRGAFIELFGIEVKDADGNKKDMTTLDAVITNNTGVMLTSVADDAYAIGYISLGSLNNTVKALKIDGTEATAENVKNGSYAIARPFNIATKGDVNPAAKDFISYILSAEGQAIVGSSYISIDDNAASYVTTNPSGKIVVAGSSSVSPIMEKLKEAYLVLNPNVTIELQTSDSTSGMTGCIDGICDIGMASRELKDTEKEQLTAIQIALDGIAVIVNQENPSEGLSKDQVNAIFTGQASVWSDISE